MLGQAVLSIPPKAEPTTPLHHRSFDDLFLPKPLCKRVGEGNGHLIWQRQLPYLRVRPPISFKSAGYLTTYTVLYCPLLRADLNRGVTEIAQGLHPKPRHTFCGGVPSKFISQPDPALYQKETLQPFNPTRGPSRGLIYTLDLAAVERQSARWLRRTSDQGTHGTVRETGAKKRRRPPARNCVKPFQEVDELDPTRIRAKETGQIWKS